MASRPQDSGAEEYKSAQFAKMVADLHKTRKYEIDRAKAVISKLNGGGSSFNMNDVNEINDDIRALDKSAKQFNSVMKALNTGKAVSQKEIEAKYDAYCYTLGMLGALTDMWETVIASNFVKNTIAALALVGKYHDMTRAAGREMEKAIGELKKELKKAEKSKYKSYIKAGLSLALDVAMIVSPQIRALSVISKFAIGGLIDVGSNLLVGKPEDFVGSTIGLINAGAELEYKARGLTKAAYAFGKAGKAMKITGLVGSASEIRDTRKAVEKIQASIASMKAMLLANAKRLEKIAKDVETARRDITNLVKRLQANATKAGNAEATYQKLKAMRDSI